MPTSPFISVPEHAPSTPVGRIAILASGRGTNFARILEAIDDGELHANVVGLVCNRPKAGCLEIAEKHDVEHAVIDHTEFASRDSFDAAVVEALRGWEPDLVVMAGWMRIATKRLIDAFPDRIVNIHPSLLPAFRGMNAVGQALDAGVNLAGCTVHVVRLAVDDGPIIGQAAVEVRSSDDEASLHTRIQVAEHALYPAAIGAYLSKLLSGT